MATTQVQYVAANSADKTHAYGSIEMPPDGLSIVDSDLLQVYVNSDLLTLTTDYTVDSGNEDVIIDAGYTLATGAIITLKRVTDIEEPYVDFTNNTATDAEEVDLVLLQLRFRLQELETETEQVLRLDTVSDCWDAEGKRICNVANATMSTDATPLGQVVALIGGGDVASTTDGIAVLEDGDGSTTVFSLSDLPTTDINRQKLLVYIDGVKQAYNTYTYTLVSGVPTCTFVDGAPATGTDNIEFIILPGIVTTTYAAETLDGDVIIENTLNGNRLEDATVDGDALVDNSVDVDKLDAGAGVDDRVAVFAADGTASARLLNLSDLDNSVAGNSMPDSFTTAVEGGFPVTTASSLSWTNSTGSTVYIIITVSAQNETCEILLDGTTIGIHGNTGSGLGYTTFSFFVPAGGVVTGSGTGEVNSLVTQAV